MAKVVRIAVTNFIKAAASVLVPSSEETATPRSALTRAGLSDRWRTKTGWTIATGSNDVISFNRAGVKAATIAAGHYSTAAALAVAIVAALNAADAGQGWACTYSAVTHKFTISATPAFILLFGTGVAPVAGYSPHIDLGFAAADTASATSQTAGSASYQSRHWLNIDVGSSMAVTCAFLRGHNVSASGTVSLDGHSVTLVGFPLEIPFAGPFDWRETLAGTDPRVKFFSNVADQYYRLVISDVQNSVGYAEVAVAFAGTYVQPSVLESCRFVEEYEQLSELHYAIGGAESVVARGYRTVYSLLWEEITGADVTLMRALGVSAPIGTRLFLVLDATANPTTSTTYGYFRTGYRGELQSVAYYNVPWQFAEALT